ncbi:MAG: AcrR family transcriptional regulator [Halieaceae bacterium]|jgi:AcrR family transcriptional regulator
MAKKAAKQHRSAGQRVGISKEGLVNLAADLADREGVSAITLARLAKLSDVRTPTISHHVGSLSELQSEVALLALDELIAVVLSASEGREGVDAVRGMYRAYRDFVLSHPGRYAASVETPDPDDPRRLEAVGRLARVLIDVFNQIGLTADDANRAARLLRAAVHGYSTLELNRAWQTPLDNDATFDWLLDVILEGLTSDSRRII